MRFLAFNHQPYHVHFNDRFLSQIPLSSLLGNLAPAIRYMPVFLLSIVLRDLSVSLPYVLSCGPSIFL